MSEAAGRPTGLRTHPDSDADGVVTVRYWAAARAAAGLEFESLSGDTVGEVIQQAVSRHRGLGAVAGVATFLLDGRAVGRDVPVPVGATLEVLPPFAGG